MSASAVASRSVSLNISNMDEDEQEEPQQKCVEELELEDDKTQRSMEDFKLDHRLTDDVPGQESEAESERLQVDAQLRAMAVSTTTTTTRTTPTGTRSASEDVNGKDRLKPFIKTCKKFESGSGSGDQDGIQDGTSIEDGQDVASNNKKRKTRRGKPKHCKLKPYSKQQPSYQQRLRCRATNRPNKAGRNPPAPYNTTQFLMEDHNELPDLDEKIAGGNCGGGAVLVSLTSADLADSDEDYFYSSPEDEDEFLSKEFSNAYEETHAERLNLLSKAQLITEYIQLEAKIDSLTKRLRSKNAAVTSTCESNEIVKKFKTLQQRCDELQLQNEQLKRENDTLRQRHGNSPVSSVDSESDSSSSRNTDCSNCDDDEEEENARCNNKTSPSSSSPVPTSYNACREKSNRRKSSSVSSVASTTDDSCPGVGSPSHNDVNTTPTHHHHRNHHHHHPTSTNDPI